MTELGLALTQVNNLYDSYEPVEDQLQKISPTERTQYADFYRAYAAYQLPQEISNRGPGHSWVPSLPNLGPGDNLPPKLYPYSEAYYPSSGGEPVTAGCTCLLVQKYLLTGTEVHKLTS